MTSPSSVATIEIFGTEIPIIEYQGQRVITFAIIDKVHQRPEGTAKDRFRKNRKRFVEGKDFYLIDSSQKNAFHSFGISIPPRGLIILTKSGYLMLVKSLTDDLAWKVQRALVNHYFRNKPTADIRSRKVQQPLFHSLLLIKSG
ncbi:MAG: hypothetical protein BWK79_13330 [Beggiatoa sp. IS2]|nr:MAG: hypothetical protein BWK79_13330 [Beggiatoa sp. IS2]